MNYNFTIQMFNLMFNEHNIVAYNATPLFHILVKL